MNNLYSELDIALSHQDSEQLAQVLRNLLLVAESDNSLLPEIMLAHKKLAELSPMRAIQIAGEACHGKDRKADAAIVEALMPQQAEIMLGLLRADFKTYLPLLARWQKSPHAGLNAALAEGFAQILPEVLADISAPKQIEILAKVVRGMGYSAALQNAAAPTIATALTVIGGKTAQVEAASIANWLPASAINTNIAQAILPFLRADFSALAAPQLYEKAKSLSLQAKSGSVLAVIANELYATLGFAPAQIKALNNNPSLAQDSAPMVRAYMAAAPIEGFLLAAHLVHNAPAAEAAAIAKIIANMPLADRSTMKKVWQNSRSDILNEALKNQLRLYLQTPTHSLGNNDLRVLAEAQMSRAADIASHSTIFAAWPAAATEMALAHFNAAHQALAMRPDYAAAAESLRLDYLLRAPKNSPLHEMLWQSYGGSLDNALAAASAKQAEALKALYAPAPKYAQNRAELLAKYKI